MTYNEIRDYYTRNYKLNPLSVIFDYVARCSFCGTWNPMLVTEFMGWHVDCMNCKKQFRLDNESEFMELNWRKK